MPQRLQNYGAERRGFRSLEDSFGDISPGEADMWYLVIALASIIASLFFGRLLARARTEQTYPHRAHGPVTESSLEVDRLAIAKDAAERRVKVHLN